MITVVVAGRNDGHGGDFAERLLRVSARNAAVLSRAGIDVEWLLVEWNPLSDRPLLSTRFVAEIPAARAVVVPQEVHRRHVSNPAMPFDEMAAKNVGIRRANGQWTLVTNGDIVFGDDLVRALANGDLRDGTLYRAHRIDVPGDTDFADLANPARHLPSGDGRWPPGYYLGGAGDFCLASTALWRRLRGFNEVVRFSTRAKDWQFFLSAGAMGVPIEFIGRVYHLDHPGGFRTTADEVRETEAAHFGGPWDIEFGLPIVNPEAWGCGAMIDQPSGEPRILRLASPVDHVDENRPGDPLRAWLGPPTLDTRLAPALVHAICWASSQGRGLTVEPREPADLVAAAGLSAVARRFGIRVSCPGTWAALPGLTAAPAPPPSHPDDLVLRQRGSGWILEEPDGQPVPGATPSRRPVLTPRFNPLLGRRLLRGWLTALRGGVRRVAIYGAGGHTRELLKWGVPDAIDVRAILITDGPGGWLDGLPIVNLAQFDPASVDAVVLSSIPFEAEMALAARARGVERVIPLWNDWPAHMLQSPRSLV